METNLGDDDTAEHGAAGGGLMASRGASTRGASARGGRSAAAGSGGQGSPSSHRGQHMEEDEDDAMAAGDDPVRGGD